MALTRPSVRLRFRRATLSSGGLPARALAFTAACAAHLFLCGFNLIGNGKFVLEEATDGSIVFDLGTEAPEITEKENFDDGRYASVEDNELWPTVVRLALAKWNDVPGTSLRLEARTSATAKADDLDKRHAIVLSKDLPFSVAAVALPIKDTDKRIIRDCDIQVGPGPTPLEDLVITVTHELGHCIGLGHNHVDYGSLMGYSAVERKFKLGLDDMAGAIYLYPASDADRSKDSSFAPCGSLGRVTAPAPGRGVRFFALLLLFLPLMAALVRHKTGGRGR